MLCSVPEVGLLDTRESRCTCCNCNHRPKATRRVLIRSRAISFRGRPATLLRWSGTHYTGRVLQHRCNEADESHFARLGHIISQGGGAHLVSTISHAIACTQAAACVYKASNPCSLIRFASRSGIQSRLAGTRCQCHTSS